MEKGKREKRNEREENDEKVENMTEGLNYNCINPQVPNFGFIVFESTECVERALAAKPIMLYGNHRYLIMVLYINIWCILTFRQIERGGEEDASAEGRKQLSGQTAG